MKWAADSEYDISDAGFELNIENARIAVNKGVVTLLHGKSGCGRDVRRARIGDMKDLLVIVDTSSMKIYINGGRTVMSTRFYPDSDMLRVGSGHDRMKVFDVRPNRFVR